MPPRPHANAAKAVTSRTAQARRRRDDRVGTKTQRTDRGNPAPGESAISDTRNSFFTELQRLKSIELNGNPELIATTFVGGLKHLPIRYELR
jgi:hypothetical protein